MAISREKKQQMVAGYVERVSRSEALIFTDYRGLTVAHLSELRQRLREVGGVFQVVKNTLFKRALDEAGISVSMEQLDGPIAVGYCFEDSPPVAKVLVAFAKETQLLKVQGSI